MSSRESGPWPLTTAPSESSTWSAFRRAPRGIPQIEVSFDIDANGIVNVSAKDRATGKEQAITITASSGLSKDEIETMKAEAASNEATDKTRREEVEFRNETDSLAHQVEKMLNENRDKIGSSDAEEIEKALATVRAALADGDMDRLRTARSEVEKASHRLAELMYKKTADSDEAAPDPAAPPPPPPPEEASARATARRTTSLMRRSWARTDLIADPLRSNAAPMPPPADYYAVLGVGRDADLLRIRQVPAARPTPAPRSEPQRPRRRGAFPADPAGLRSCSATPSAGPNTTAAAGPSRPPPGSSASTTVLPGSISVRSRRRKSGRSTRFLAVPKGPIPGPAKPIPIIHARVRISFVESLGGKQIRLRTSRREACGPCLGRGERPVAEATPQGIECSACSGAGRRLRRYGHMVFARPCRRCGGRGLLFHTACSACAGRGSRIRSVRVVARVPAGVADGATVVVEGQGHERLPGAPPGDLRLYVEVAPHPALERRGDNLVCPLPLTLAEAALGGRIEVPTLSGNVIVRLPPGVQPGTRLRLAGRGVPSIRGDGRGDLFLEVRVHIPEIRDDHSRDLVRELEARYPQSPRDALREKLRSEESP